MHRPTHQGPEQAILGTQASRSDVSLVRLREAIEASWRPDTAYLGVRREGTPALGNCYPTARVVQHFFPRFEIVEGTVWTGTALEKHFWNELLIDGTRYPLDLTWQQFPIGSVVRQHATRDRESLGDSDQTQTRVTLLLNRVHAFLAAGA